MTAAERPINLPVIAQETLLRYGFLVEPPPTALAELALLAEPDFSHPTFKGLTGWLWSSIDNDDSRDLDQIEYVRLVPRGTRLYVGIADVASFVTRGGFCAANVAGTSNRLSIRAVDGFFAVFHLGECFFDPPDSSISQERERNNSPVPLTRGVKLRGAPRAIE